MGIAGLVGVFLLILVLALLRVRFSITVAAATAVLLLSSGGTSAPAALRAAGAPDTLELVATVALITFLAGLMRSTELLIPLGKSLAGTLRSDRLAFALVPGILGCLPVPGGAGISAPMVDGLGLTLCLSPERKAAANMLLRHAWFFVFPFNPPLILSAHLSRLPVSRIIAHQWPLSVLALLTAAVLFLRGGSAGSDGRRPWRQELLEFAVTASPILASVSLYLAAGLSFPLALAAGVGVACLVAGRRGTLTRATLLASVDWEMPLATEIIMIFAALLRETPGLMAAVASVTAGSPLGTVFLVSTVSGFVTGNTVAAMGIALPALLPLVPPGVELLPYVSLIYSLAFQSYLISPLHMCLILTARYFGVGLGQMYRHLLLPVAVNLAGVTALFFLTCR